MNARTLKLAVLAATPLFLATDCDSTASGSDSTIVFRIVVEWSEPADLDLHVWRPGLGQCSQDGCPGSSPVYDGITRDVTDAAGQELYSANQFLAVGRYRVGVNLHAINPPATPGPRTATMTVTIWGAGSAQDVYTYGPYTFTQEVEDGGYPVTGDTAGWWRPLDIVVDDQLHASVAAPDGTALSF